MLLYLLYFVLYLMFKCRWSLARWLQIPFGGMITLKDRVMAAHMYLIMVVNAIVSPIYDDNVSTDRVGSSSSSSKHTLHNSLFFEKACLQSDYTCGMDCSKEERSAVCFIQKHVVKQRFHLHMMKSLSAEFTLSDTFDCFLVSNVGR